MLEPGSFEVGIRDVVLVDAARPTAANGRYAAVPTRTFKTTIWYPAEARSLEPLRWGPPPVAHRGGPFPLVIYSHGFMSFRTEGEYLARHLASHGYIVVAANYPLTNYFTAGGPSLADVVNQPGDVRFLIDTMLAWSQDPKQEFAGAVDAERIAVAGLSLGGMTTTLATFHPRLRDPRIRAAVSLAGPCSMFGPAFYQTVDTPYLAVAGDIDAIVKFEENAGTLETRAPGATLVTLKGASHTGFTNISSVLFRWLNNPDWVGCSSLKGNLPKNGDFLKYLGDAADGLMPVAANLPCLEPELPHALRPARQHELTILAVYNFLQSRFATEQVAREAAAAYLRYGFARENPEAVVRMPGG